MIDEVKTENKSELPENWEWTKLGDVVTKIIGGGTPSKNKSQYWEGDIPWLTVKDMRSRRPADAMDHISEKAVEESSTNIIPEDTVIIATRIGLGKVIRVPYKAAINQDLKALVVPPEIDKGYLEYWFVSKTNYLESIGSGTTVKGIRLEQVRDLDFPLAPPEQQKRIVAKIEELFSHIDAGIEALKKAKQLLKQYRQSVLKAAVTGELTKEWREANKDKLEPGSKLYDRILSRNREAWNGNGKFKEPKSFNLNDISPIPKSWCYCSAETVCFELFLGLTSKVDYVEEGGVPLVRAKDITGGRLSFTEVRCISERQHKELTKYRKAKKGDVLVSKSGSLGTCALVEVDREFSIYESIISMRAIKEFLLPAYLLWMLRSPAVQERMLGKKVGMTVGHLNLGSYRKLLLPIPTIEEQRIIVELVEQKITTIAHVENEIEVQLHKAERNKQSILASAFSGKV